MSDASVLVVGEALVDLISEVGSWRFDAAPGGSPLNVAVGLAAAGHPVRLASEVGADLFGGLIRDHLHRHRVDCGDLTVTSAATSLAIARVDVTGQAEYDFRFSWTWPGRATLTGIDCLHVGSLSAVTEPGAAAVRATVDAARRHGIPVSYDPNVRPALMDNVTGRIEHLVAQSNLVKVSSEDLAWLYPDQPDLAAAAAWARSGPRLVVVTRGGQGAVALTGGYTIECTTPPVDVVDTVGAGDAFTAGLLSQLATSLADPSEPVITEALRYATAAAAAVCTYRGAQPPPAAAVAALLPATVATGPA